MTDKQGDALFNGIQIALFVGQGLAPLESISLDKIDHIEEAAVTLAGIENECPCPDFWGMVAEREWMSVCDRIADYIGDGYGCPTYDQIKEWVMR